MENARSAAELSKEYGDSMSRRRFIKGMCLGIFPILLSGFSERVDNQAIKEGKMRYRAAGNRGAFYPGSCSSIKDMIEKFNNLLDRSITDRSILDVKPRAVIAPHAGYIYSGFTANIAHRILANYRSKRTVVIGPSHHVFIEGVSGSFMRRYETPCGDLEIDEPYLQELKDRFNLSFVEEAHRVEHSTETQMPFIEHYSPDSSIIELIYGRVGYIELAKLIGEILNDPDNTVVISSDLSHFHTLERAEHLDGICLSGVAEKSIETLDSGCEACGITGIKAIVKIAGERSWKSRVLDYRTSADASGDRNRVVGYMSALFGDVI